MLAAAPAVAEPAATVATGPVVATAPIKAPGSGACSGGGYIWWSELLAPETEKLTDFYSKVIGWNIKVVDADDSARAPVTPDDRYTTFMNGDQAIAGLMKANHPVAVHSGLGWFTYIEVADVDEAIEKVEANGGSVLRPPAENENGDRIAVVNDPMGNVFGLVTPADEPSC